MNRVITEMAQKSVCVIVGRCGDYILREFSATAQFVSSIWDFCILSGHASSIQSIS